MQYFEHLPIDKDESGVPLLARQRMARQGTEPSLKTLATSTWRRWLTVSGLLARVGLHKARTALWSRVYDWVSEGKARAEEKDWVALGQLLQKKLGALKGPLMKFGQMASYVDDRLSPHFRDLLSALQDRSPAMDPHVIRQSVEDSLGKSIKELFAEWEDQPLAAASIAQLHLARLHTGERVVVKVKYPGIEAAIRSDLRLVDVLAPWLARRMGVSNMRQLLDELGSMILAECDFFAEAENQDLYRSAFSHDPSVVIAKVFPSHSTRDVLTMEYIDGKSFADFKAEATSEQKNRACEIIVRVAAESIHKHCIYNGDPHPGNYLFLSDGRVAFLDFGFTRRWKPDFINLHKRQALTAYEGDVEAFTAVARQMGHKTDHPEAYRELMEALLAGPYAPWLEDRPFRFTRAFLRDEIQRITGVYRRFIPLNLSREHLVLQRVMWGQHALFSDLNAEINLHQIVLPLVRQPLREDQTPGSGQFLAETAAIKVRPIRNIFELWEVYRITHDCYVETGYIHPRPTGLLVHYAEFDHIPETMILVALRGSQIVGSISYTLDGPSGLIIEKDYPAEYQKIRQEGRLVADVWRLVIKKEYRADKQVLMALVTQMAQILIVPLGVKTWLLDVHERHEVAYKRLFNMVPVARRKGVPGLEQEHIAAVLLRFDIERIPKSWQAKLGASPTLDPSQTPSAIIPSVLTGMENAKHFAEQYEQRILTARRQFNEGLMARKLTAPDADDELLVLFLINFCAYGVGMTRPVESWISRVGSRCEEMGLVEEGHAFKRHALLKSNHHLLLVADLRSLTAFWNERFKHPHLVADKLLSRPTPAGVLKYQQLHEAIVLGQEPFRQFAVEYEVDRLSLEYGAWIVSRCIQRFGRVFLSRMTFFQKDVSLEVGRTQFNWLGLGNLLAKHPQFLDPLVEGGANALDVYRQFLAECIVEAEKMKNAPK